MHVSAERQHVMRPRGTAAWHALATCYALAMVRRLQIGFERRSLDEGWRLEGAELLAQPVEATLIRHDRRRKSSQRRALVHEWTAQGRDTAADVIRREP